MQKQLKARRLAFTLILLSSLLSKAEFIGPSPSLSENLTSDYAVVKSTDQIPTDTLRRGEYQRGLHIKSNVAAYAMLWLNVALEYDLACHWSVAVPVYHSGWNYFHRTTKFRTLTVLPEVRYWFNPSNTGFFVALHGGVAYYNVAFGGEYRYQDHNANTPAKGGGFNAGYRFYFCHNHNWSMEATIGAGAYKLDYDIFDNKVNGHVIGRKKRNFFGIDNAAISFCYRFDMGRMKR